MEHKTMNIIEFKLEQKKKAFQKIPSINLQNGDYIKFFKDSKKPFPYIYRAELYTPNTPLYKDKVLSYHYTTLADAKEYYQNR